MNSNLNPEPIRYIDFLRALANSNESENQLMFQNIMKIHKEYSSEGSSSHSSESKQANVTYPPEFDGVFTKNGQLVYGADQIFLELSTDAFKEIFNNWGIIVLRPLPAQENAGKLVFGCGNKPVREFDSNVYSIDEITQSGYLSYVEYKTEIQKLKHAHEGDVTIDMDIFKNPTIVAKIDLHVYSFNPLLFYLFLTKIQFDSIISEACPVFDPVDDNVISNLNKLLKKNGKVYRGNDSQGLYYDGGGRPEELRSGSPILIKKGENEVNRINEVFKEVLTVSELVKLVEDFLFRCVDALKPKSNKKSLPAGFDECFTKIAQGYYTFFLGDNFLWHGHILMLCNVLERIQDKFTSGDISIDLTCGIYLEDAEIATLCNFICDKKIDCIKEISIGGIVEEKAQLALSSLIAQKNHIESISFYIDLRLLTEDGLTAYHMIIDAAKESSVKLNFSTSMAEESQSELVAPLKSMITRYDKYLANKEHKQELYKSPKRKTRP